MYVRMCSYVCRSPLCSDLSEEPFKAEVMGRIPNQVSITSTEPLFGIWCEGPGNDGLGSHCHNKYVCTDIYVFKFHMGYVLAWVTSKEKQCTHL